MNEFTIKVKDLELIMEDQWKEIEELMKELEKKSKTFEGFNYNFISYLEHKENKDSTIFNYNESCKLDLFIKAYVENKFIVDILINDLEELIEHLESNKFYNKVFEKDSEVKHEQLEGLTEDEILQLRESMDLMEIFQLECAKETMKGLVKIFNKRYLLHENGIKSKVDIHKRITRERRKDELKNTSKYINHKNSMENEFNDYDKELLLLKFNNSCALTGESENIEFDHVIPISWRVFGTTINNIIPLNKSLNASKGNRNIFKWYEENKDKFDIDEYKFKNAISYVAELNNMTYDEYEKFVYIREKEVMEKVIQLEQEVNKLEIERAKIDNKIFESKSEMTYLDE